MHFSRNGEFFSVSRITGPHHNLLQIRLSKGDADATALECLPAIGSCTHPPLDSDKLLVAVLEGIAKANLELGTAYWAAHVRYVGNDTPPESVYGFLALSIVRHLESGGTFVEV